MRAASASRNGEWLTIKLDDVMPDALNQGTATRFLDNQTLLSGSTKGSKEDEEERGSNDREDDGKDAKTPAPVNLIEPELLRGLGARKCGDYVGRRGECVGETSILYLGGIGGDNIHAIGDAHKADVVEDVGSTEHGVVCARSHENNSEGDKGGHAEKALRTAPNIKNLGQWDEDSGRHGVGHNVNGVELRVRLVETGDVGDNGPDDGRHEGIGEVEQPDTVMGSLLAIVIGTFSIHVGEY